MHMCRSCPHLSPAHSSGRQRPRRLMKGMHFALTARHAPYTMQAAAAQYTHRAGDHCHTQLQRTRVRHATGVCQLHSSRVGMQ